LKPTPKLFAAGLAVFLVAVMGITLMIQQQALSGFRKQNQSLHQQIDALTVQLDNLRQEKARFSKAMAAPEANTGAPLVTEQFSELLRLRGEMGRLRLQERELEQLLQDQMQAAQAKVASAESELARLTKMHSAGVVSPHELEQGRFALELLKAQARGDTAEIARIRLEQAEAELALAAKLLKVGRMSSTEYQKALDQAESLRGESQR
jgi:hypothetical protein